MRRLGIRRRLFLVVVTTVAGAITALVIGFNVILGQSLDGDARDVAHSRASAERDLLATTGGHVTVQGHDDAAADALVWVFAGREIEHPRANASVEKAARTLAGSGVSSVDVPAADIRLYAEPVIAGGRRIGTIVAGVSVSPYEETRSIALVASTAFGGLVLILVAAAASWLLGSSLRPVRRMTRQAAAWSERDLDHRFGLGAPHDELTELAATLDQLLDRLATSLRREQRFSAELSHELRTPLARVMAEAELALRRERSPDEYRQALEQVSRNAAQLTRTIDALMAAARHEAGFERGTADAYSIAAEAAAGCAERVAQRSLELTVTPPSPPVRVGIDPELGERILQPLLDNACRYGRTAIDVTIDRLDGLVRFTIADDGPGVSPDDRERIFEPGIRGASIGRDDDGAGLGLSLARRLARSVSGDVAVLDADPGGRFVVTLPRA